jgi:hypothetical protein
MTLLYYTTSPTASNTGPQTNKLYSKEKAKHIHHQMFNTPSLQTNQEVFCVQFENTLTQHCSVTFAPSSSVDCR